jgi:hypothetical protein
LNNEEYRRLIDLLRTSNDPKMINGIVALIAFQFHLLACVDNECQWTTEHLRLHNCFPDQALWVKLHWSKICNDERDAPWQIMLGSMSTYYCVLITVGIWLEVFLAYPGAGLNPHIFGFSDDFEGGD